MSSSRVLPTHSRFRERRRKRRVILGLLCVAAILVLSVGAVEFLRAPFVRIQRVALFGTETLATSTLQEFLRQELAGDYLLVLPKDSIFLYPKQRIMADVLAAFPQLQSVSVRANTLSAITVAVAEREPRALWCGEAPATSSPCLFLDGSGVAYARAPQFSSPVYPVFFGALAGSAEALPAQFLTPAQFRSLTPLIAALDAAAQARGSGAEAYAFVDSNGDVHLQFLSGFAVLFALSNDAAEVANHFSLALSSSALTSVSLSGVLYIDLRFGEKLYYKMK